MNDKISHVDQAWGLDFGGSAVRLVRVSRQPDGYRVEECHRLALGQRWSSTPGTPGAMDGASGLFPAALTGLISHPLEQPLAICLPDEAVLFRTVRLPPSDAPTRDKMVRAQLEVLLPSRAERFACAWEHSNGTPLSGSGAGSGGGGGGGGGPQTVLMTAVRRDALEQATALGRGLGQAPTAAVPAALAANAALGLAGPATAGTVVLIDIGARSTPLVLLRDGKVLGCTVHDRGADAWVQQIAAGATLSLAQAEAAMIAHLGADADEDTPGAAGVGPPLRAALGDWLQHLGEAYQGLVQDLPRDQRPSRAILLGRAAQGPAIAALVSEALRLPAAPAHPGPHVRSADGVPFDDALPAVGAAIQLLNPAAPVPTFIAPQVEQPRATGATRRRWVLAGAWVLAALALLYGADRFEAWSLGASLDALHASDRRTGGLDQPLGVGQYLQDQGAPPLVVLDAIAAAAPRPMLLTGWTYTREGDLRIITSFPQPDMVDAYLKALGDSPLFRGVEVRSIRTNRGQWECEVNAVLAQRLPPGLMAPRPAPKGAKP